MPSSGSKGSLEGALRPSSGSKESLKSSGQSPPFTAASIPAVLYPVDNITDDQYNPGTPLIMTALHDTKSLVAFVQGVGDMHKWVLAGCQVGHQALDTNTKDVWQHMWWVVVECLYPKDPAFDPRTLNGGEITLTFREKDGSAMKVLTSTFPFSASRSIPHVPSRLSRLSYKTCIVTQLYNQTHILKDWATYHNRIGIDHILIYDNDSDDDLLGFIAREGLSNLITVIRFPWGKSQAAAFLHGKVLADRLCHWTFFPDVDEYLFLKFCRPTMSPPSFRHCLAEFIRNQTAYSFSSPDQRPPRNSQLLIVPKIFSSSNIVHRPPQPYTLSETFLLRSPLPHAHATLTHKPLINSRTAQLSTAIHRFKIAPPHTSTTISTKIAELIHYKAQSWEDYMLKYNRPRNGFVRNWMLPKGLKWPLSRDRPPKGWREGTFFHGQRELANATVQDTEFRDWKREMERVLGVGTPDPLHNTRR